jgi:hypothetical protein
MGWSVGYDSTWKRDIGYGVPALCDHPGCPVEIDRGLAHVCGGEPYGGEHGCGLFFCGNHRRFHSFRDGRCLEVCFRCDRYQRPFAAKPDVPTWINWKLTDESWQKWREENPEEVARLRATQPQSGDGNAPHG